MNSFPFQFLIFSRIFLVARLSRVVIESKKLVPPISKKPVLDGTRLEQRPVPALLLQAQMDNDNEIVSVAHSDTALEVPPAKVPKKGTGIMRMIIQMARVVAGVILAMNTTMMMMGKFRATPGVISYSRDTLAIEENY